MATCYKRDNPHLSPSPVCGACLSDALGKVATLECQIEAMKNERALVVGGHGKAIDRALDLAKKLEESNRLIRANEVAREMRKSRCAERCQHPADFVCDYEDGTLHCLECIAEKFWQLEDILSGKHNVHTYLGALETIAHPERYLTKFDPIEIAKGALSEKRKCRELNFSTQECILLVGHCGSHQFAEKREVLMKINVNGVDHNWPDSKPLYYEDVLKLSGEREGASVVCKPADKRLAGFTLIRGQSCPPTEGLKINCIMTGNA